MVFNQVLLFLSAAVMLFSPNPQLIGRNISAERYDVNIVLQKGGSLLVTEDFAIRFQGGPFTSISRSLSPLETDGIGNLQVSMDGKTLVQGSQPGQVEINEGGNIDIVWHFAPVSNSIHTFKMTYLVAGVVRQDKTTDALIWRAISNEHDFRIDSASMRLSYPQGVTLQGRPRSNHSRTQLEISPGEILMVTQNIRPDSGFVVNVHFSQGSLISEPPHWQARQIEMNRQIKSALPVALSTSAIVLVLGILLPLLANRSSISRPALPQTKEAYPTEPPDNLAPAIVGLLFSPNGEPSSSQALATLFELAQRRIIRIEEQEKHHFLTRRDFAIDLETDSSTLAPHQLGLLELFFETGHGPRPQVRISDLGKVLQDRWQIFADPLREELRDAKFMNHEKQNQRRSMVTIGLLQLFVGALVFISSALWLGLITQLAATGIWKSFLMTIILLGIGLSLFVAGMATMILSRRISLYSHQGALEAARWHGYAEYLRAVLRGKEPIPPTDLFETGLPYAASLGFAEKWIHTFQKHSHVQIPVWFQAFPNRTRDEAMAAMAAMVIAAKAVGEGSEAEPESGESTSRPGETG